MKYIIFLFVFLSRLSFAQKHDNTWLIGNGYTNINPFQEKSYRIDFNQSIFQQDTIVRNMTIELTSASICDTAGNLQFYTNGFFINDYTHQLMENGDSLGGTDFMNVYRSASRGFNIIQGAIILPHSDSSHLYYLLHQTVSFYTIQTYSPPYNIAERLYYTLIDMRANNGRGRVRFKNQELAVTTSNEKLKAGQLKAAKHANGKDWWLVQPLGDSISFTTFLVKGDSIIRQPNQSFHVSINNVGNEFATFSPDAKRYAMRNYLDSTLYIFDFNRCTGRFDKNFVRIKDTTRMWSVVFSPNNKFLYTSDTRNLFQYDLAETNIAASKIKVGDVHPVICDSVSPSVCTVLSYFINAPDGKIYAMSNRPYLHVIEKPNEKGRSCDFRAHAIALNTGLIGSTVLDDFPNFAHYRTPAIPESECWTSTGEQGGEVISSVGEIEKEGVKLYPNPANTEINLYTSNILAENTKVTIYNSLGQIVKMQIISNETNTLLINIQDLPNGIYTLQVSSETNPIVKQFVIAR